MIWSKKFINEISYEALGAAIEVHKTMGPGLLESVYHRCMEIELGLRGVNFETEFEIATNYKGHDLSVNFRGDLLLEECIMIELKAIKQFEEIHFAKAISHINLLEVPKAILINFNVMNIMEHGQKTLVNEIFRNLSNE